MEQELNAKYKKVVVRFIAMCFFLLIGLLLGRYIYSYLGFLMFASVGPAALMSGAIKSIKCTNCEVGLWHCARSGQSPIYPFTISTHLNFCPNCGVNIRESKEIGVKHDPEK